MAYRTEIEKLEQRHAENPKQWFAALADAYRKQGEVDLAIEYVKSGLVERPDYASAHIVLGRCYLDKDMDNDAASSFRQVLELDAENIIALKSLGEISERQGDAAAARSWLTRLLEVDPMNEEAQEAITRLGAAESIDSAPAEEKVAASELDEMALELGSEILAAEEVEIPGEVTPEAVPHGIEHTVSEEAIDASALDLEPMAFEATTPLEESGFESIWSSEASEPLDIITEETEGIELVSSQEDDEEIGEGFAAPPMAQIELERVDEGAGSLLSSMSDLIGPDDDSAEFSDDDSITAEIEPIELEAPEDAASSLLHESVRASVPPTKEVEAVELEAMRDEDERVLRPTLDEPLDLAEHPDFDLPLDAAVDEAPADSRDSLGPPVGEVLPEIEPDYPGEAGDTEDALEVVDQEDATTAEEEDVEDIPKTTQIDAVELERLRQLDAAEAGVGGEPDEGEEQEAAEHVEAVERVEPLDRVEEIEEGESAVQDETPLPLIMPDEETVASSASSEPEPVVTETMAEVYARQGLFDQAREIYEVLAKQHPGDARLRERVEELNARTMSALQETRQSRFSAKATGGESVVTYLQRVFRPIEGSRQAPVAEPEPPSETILEPSEETAFDAEQTPLEQAFSDDPPTPPGEPTVPAADEVSLASVFDGSAPGTGSSLPDEPPDTEDGVSYDEFYGTDSAGSDSQSNDKDDEDRSPDDDFKNWLEGLKT